MLGFYLPQEGQHQLHELGTRDHFLVKDDQAAQEVVISLGASQGFSHLGEKQRRVNAMARKTNQRMLLVMLR